MADDSGDAGGNAIGTRIGHSLRQRGEEEMGNQFSVHGILRVRGGVDLLGNLGLQDVVRGEADPYLGQSGNRLGLQDHASAGYASVHSDVGRCDGHSVLSVSDNGLLPVCLCGHLSDPPGGCLARAHELHCLDGVRPVVAHFLLQYRCIRLVGWRLSVPMGCHRLLWWLCHPSLCRSCWVHRRLLGKKSHHLPEIQSNFAKLWSGFEAI